MGDSPKDWHCDRTRKDQPEVSAEARTSADEFARKLFPSESTNDVAGRAYLSSLYLVHTQPLRDRVAELEKHDCYTLLSKQAAASHLGGRMSRDEEVEGLRSDLEAARAERDEARKLLAPCQRRVACRFPGKHETFSWHGQELCSNTCVCDRERPCPDHDREEKGKGE